MKLITKNDKLNDVGEESITKEIKRNVEKPEWIITGGKKKWPRKCKFCGNVKYYNRFSHFHRANRINGRCSICIKENTRKGWHHTKETKNRISKSQQGKNNSFYGRRHTEENKRLYSKRNKGKNNPMYGKVSAMFGKKHTEDSIKKQIQKRKDFWKSKGHDCKNEFTKYRTEVDRLTRHQPLHLLENYTKKR